MARNGNLPGPELSQLLHDHGFLNQETLNEVLTEHRQSGEFLGTILLRRGLATEDQLLPVLAAHFGLPCERLVEAAIHPEALAKVPAKFANRYGLMPLRWENDTLHAAIHDPSDVRGSDELRILLGCNVKLVLATQRDIEEAIQLYYGVGASSVEELLGAAGATDGTTHSVEDIGTAVDETSIASFVNQLILQAVKDRATDIHIEPIEHDMRIRERIDGVLYEVPLPRNLQKFQRALVSRIKVMARLDIAEKRLPQDGRIKTRLEGQDMDLRVSVIPMILGEGIDIRILTYRKQYSLERLGLAEDHLQLLSQLIQQSHGITFVSGPTGSGKTTTLYACLSKLNDEHRNIVTIEDPVECQLEGVNQIQVHPKIGLTFANGLRSMLRHDPNIIMVGEVRDPETAEITIRSALTGHLVFSTLHTNDAAGAVSRLLDMGIEPYLVASSVRCFIAQRLVRIVCPVCRADIVPEARLREEFGVAELPSRISQGAGCAACKHTGYKGRTAIYEFLPVTDGVQALILKRSSSQEIKRLAIQEGMRTLRQDGWLKVCQGITTPQEVLRGI